MLRVDSIEGVVVYVVFCYGTLAVSWFVDTKAEVVSNVTLLDENLSAGLFHPDCIVGIMGKL